MAQQATSQIMSRDEFELRFTAYRGMKTRFRLEWDTEILINLTKRTDQGQLTHALNQTSVDELHLLTKQTYTPFKQQFITDQTDKKVWSDARFSLSDYIERLEYELKVIKEMGFNSYFLVVSDYVRWAKSHQISVWPGRGSGAGSLLAWFIGITELNPLPFDLLFERFLNPARVSMPDFDIDFEDTLRQQVIEYVTQKYGVENVCSIGTFMKMAGKAAFKDAARALGVPFEKSNYVSNLIPDKVWLLDLVTKTPEDENQEIKRLYETDEKVKSAIEYGNALTGNMRQLWVHACGIIIAPEPVTTFTSTQYNKESDHTIVSQYDGPTLEKIWLLKMDFLWLRNLSIIKNCIKIIKARADNLGKQIPENFQYFLDTMSLDIPLDDAETFEQVFKNGETTGIFQFESAGMRRYLIQLEPDKFDNLIAMAALYRPGPMDYIPAYIARRLGKEEIEYLYPKLRDELLKKYWPEVVEEERKKLIEDLDPIMHTTYGIAVYQEQLMFLVQAMAGFSLSEADELRRGVGKKKLEVVERLKAEFIKRGAEFRNYKPETVKTIYEEMIMPAANYSFNKSHAACYALIAYQTAFLKTHYPIEFHAALVRSVEEDVDTQSFYISEIQEHGIQLFWPDVNISFNHVAALDESIRLGFISIKWVGFDVGEFIQKERERWGDYTSLENFCKRCSSVINKKSLEGLIKSGALDRFADRKVLRNNLEVIQDWIKTSANADQGLFGGMETVIPLKSVTPATHMENLMMEQEVFKTFVSWNPLDGFYQFAKKHSFLSQVLAKDDYPYFEIIAYIREIRKAKKKWFFVKISDITADFEIFLSDLCGLERFDFVILSGAKRRYETKDGEKKSRINVYKIIKTTYEKLQHLAWGLFNPADTVVAVMKVRTEDLKPKVTNDSVASTLSHDISSSINVWSSSDSEDDADNEQHLDVSDREEILAWQEEGEIMLEDETDEQELDAQDLSDTLDTSDFGALVDNSLGGDCPETDSSACKTTSESSEEPASNAVSQDEWDTMYTLETLHLTMPQLQEVIQIIKQYPWEKPLRVMGKEVFISEAGRELLGKFRM